MKAVNCSRLPSSFEKEIWKVESVSGVSIACLVYVDTVTIQMMDLIPEVLWYSGI